MATGNPTDYVLFHPKRRMANKTLALKLAAAHFDGEIIDNTTVSASSWGDCHVVAYTDLSGAMIATTETDVKFGDVPWHAKGRIILVREQPKKGSGSARTTFYVCNIKDLFGHKSVGHSGVLWIDVGKVKLYGKTVFSQELKDTLSSTNED